MRGPSSGVVPLITFWNHGGEDGDGDEEGGQDWKAQISEAAR